MRLKRYSCIFFSMLIICSIACKPRIETVPDLVKYLQEKKNGLFQEQKVRDILTTAYYLPTRLLELRESRSKQSNTQRKTSQDNLNKKTYFVIRFSKDKKELLGQLDMTIYSEIFQVLSFNMQPLIGLKLDDGHVISPLDCSFQQTYGLGSSNELVVIFNSKEIEKSDTYTLTVDEFGLGLGELTYIFHRDQIDKLKSSLNL